MSNQPLAQFGHLLNGYDAGIYSLPDDVIAARTTFQVLKAYTVPVMPSRTDLDRDAELAMTRAAAAGKPLSTSIADPVLAGETAIRKADIAWQVLRTAREHAEGAVRELIIDHGIEIITDHLRPALDRIIAAARDDAKLLAGFGSVIEPRLIISEDDDRKRRAFIAMEEHYRNYSAIHDARGVTWGKPEYMTSLGRAGIRPQHDNEYAIFAKIKNPHTYYEIRNAGIPFRPWPLDDPQATFRWQLNNGAEFWLPTPDEQDAEWYKHRGEDLERTQRGKHWGAGWRAVGER